MVNKNNIFKTFLLVVTLLFLINLCSAAWFNSTWEYKRQINLTGDVGKISYLYEINYSAGMQEDYDDLRFINNAEDTEFNYTIETYNSTRAIVRIYSQGENSFWLYYGNSEASSTSQTAGVFHFNPIAGYYLDGNANDFMNNYNGTVYGATVTTGKIGQGYSFDGGDQIITSPHTNTNTRTYSFWVKFNSLAGNHNGQYILSSVYSPENWKNEFIGLLESSKITFNVNSQSGSLTGWNTPAFVNINTWYHVVVVVTGTTMSSSSVKIYINGVEQSLTYGTLGVSRTRYLVNQQIEMGTFSKDTWYSKLNGIIDGVLIYNRELTTDEISALYNYTAPTYLVGEEETSSQPPIVTLISPANDSLQETLSVDFIANVTDDLNVENVSLYIDGVLNQTNSSGYNGTYTFTVNVPESNHNWSILAYDNDSDSTQSETRIFLSDFYDPVVTIDFPVDAGEYNYNITTLNSTASDTHLEACWYSIDNFVTNTTFTCNTNITFNKINITYDTSNFTGWISSPAGMPITTCGSYPMFGGYNQFGQNAYAQTTLNLPAGIYNISWYYYAVDSWDGESGRVSINGTPVWTKSFTASGNNICGISTGESNNVLNNTYYYEYNHSGGEFTLKFDSTLDQSASDESWGFNNVQVVSEGIYFGSNEGFNTWSVCANDSASHETCDSVTFEVDTTQPFVNITYPINGTYYDTQLTSLNYDATDTNLYQCWYSTDFGLTNSTPGTCTGSFSVNSVEGQNNWTVYAIDSFGNENSSSVTFFQDTLSPEVTIIQPINQTYATISMDYTVSLNEPVQSCLYSLDNFVTNQTMNEINSTYFSYTESISTGDFTVNFACIDFAGNDGYNQSNFTIKTVSTTLNSPEDNYIYYDFSPITFNATGETVEGYITNMSLWTNVSGDWEVYNTTEYTIGLNITSGNWVINLTNDIVWNVQTCNSEDSCEFADTNYSIFRDKTMPQINLTYPENVTYTISPTELNYTISDLGDNLDMCWYSNDSGVTNYSIQTAGENFTIVSQEGINTQTVYCNDTVNNVNSTSVTYFVDTINPVVTILFPLNDSRFNETSLVQWFNYTVDDANGDVCWYSTDGGVTNSTEYASGTNFSIPSELGENHWIVYCEDILDNFGMNETTFYIYDLNFTIDDTLIEVGANTSINTSINLWNVSLDIPHSQYGINYITNLFNLTLNLMIDYFEKYLFSNGDNYQELEFTYINNSTYAQDNFSIDLHNYDYIDNVSFNMSGLTTGDNFVITKINSTDIDRAYYGNLIGPNLFINKIFDNTDQVTPYLTERNISFENKGDKSVYLYLDKNAKLINFMLNLTGFEFGFEFLEDFETDEYQDEILTTARQLGGVVIPGGNNPKNFTYDEFNDSSIDFNKWIFSMANGYYNTDPADPYEGYDYSIENNEGIGYLELKINNFQEDFRNDERGTYSTTNSLYGNYTQLNIWTPEQIVFGIDYYIFGEEDNDRNQCNYYNAITLGQKEFWRSKRDTCEYDFGGGDYGDCYEYATTDDNTLEITLTRQLNNSWKVEYSGYEKTYFEAKYDGISYDCGWGTKIYDYDKGQIRLTYSDTNDPLCINTNTTLQNVTYINDLEYAHMDQFLVTQYVEGYYRDDLGEGCSNIDSWFKIKYINQTLVNITNSSYYSQSIFDSAADISSIYYNNELVYPSITPANYLVYNYGSSDNGDNYQSLISNSTNNLINPGRNIKYYFDFIYENSDYLKNVPFVKSISINTPKSYPTNISLDFGNDGIMDYNFPDELNDSNGPIQANLTLSDISGSFSGVPEVGQTWLVPLVIYSDTAGIIEISDINLTYNPNPIVIDRLSIQDYLNRLSSGIMERLNFTFGAINGTINLSDLKIKYLGGNYTLPITAHSDDYVMNRTINVTYHFSQWDYHWVPEGIDFIYFAPTNPTSKNVSAYGQTSTIPIINLTNLGYGGKNATLYSKLDSNLDCVNLTLSFSNNKSEGFQLNDTYQELINLDYLDTEDIYLWADFNCNYNNYYTYSPNLYFTLCVEGGLCDERPI